MIDLGKLLVKYSVSPEEIIVIKRGRSSLIAGVWQGRERGTAKRGGYIYITVCGGARSFTLLGICHLDTAGPLVPGAAAQHRPQSTGDSSSCEPIYLCFSSWPLFWQRSRHNRPLISTTKVSQNLYFRLKSQSVK